MWFMNNFANPLVRLMLRSPLHGILSSALLLITYRGRKSGKEYTLPTQYARDGRSIYIVVGAAEQKTWWRNLKDGAPVQLTLESKTLPAKATLLDHQDAAQSIAKALHLYLQRFPALAKSYQVRTEADGRFNTEDIQNASQSVTMMLVELDKRNST